MQTSNLPIKAVPKMDWGILFLLFFVAWGLRVIGLDWGYLHGDERVNQAAKVLAGELIPDQHFYPPSSFFCSLWSLHKWLSFGRLIF